jgi:hypothetical protein
VSARIPGTSPPDSGTRRAHALFKAAIPYLFLPMALFGLAAAIGGPVILWLLISRGLREGRPSWVALGVLCGLPWLLLVMLAVRGGLRALFKGRGDPAGGGDDVGR